MAWVDIDNSEIAVGKPIKQTLFQRIKDNLDYLYTYNNVNNVTNSGTSTDNAVARFDSTTGKIIQNSTVIIDDSGNISAGNGSASASSYSFVNSINTGMYYNNRLMFSVGGNNSFSIGSYYSYTQMASYRIYHSLSDYSAPVFFATNDTGTAFKRMQLGIQSADNTGIAGYANGNETTDGMVRIQTFFDSKRSNAQDTDRYAHIIKTEHDSTSINRNSINFYLWKYGDAAGGYGSHMALSVQPFQSYWHGRRKTLTDNATNSILDINVASNSSATVIVSASLTCVVGNVVKHASIDITCIVKNENGTISTNIRSTETQYSAPDIIITPTLVAGTAKATLNIFADSTNNSTIDMHYECKYLGVTTNTITFL